jgi:hypothetical protein
MLPSIEFTRQNDELAVAFDLKRDALRGFRPSSARRRSVLAVRRVLSLLPKSATTLAENWRRPIAM